MRDPSSILSLAHLDDVILVTTVKIDFHQLLPMLIDFTNSYLALIVCIFDL